MNETTQKINMRDKFISKAFFFFFPSFIHNFILRQMESEEEILVHPKNTWKRSTIRRDIQVSYIYVYMYNNARQKICTPNYHQSSSWLFIYFFILLKEALWTIHVVYIISCHLFSAVIWEAQHVLFLFVHSLQYFSF